MALTDKRVGELHRPMSLLLRHLHTSLPLSYVPFPRLCDTPSLTLHCKECHRSMWERGGTTQGRQVFAARNVVHQQSRLQCCKRETLFFWPSHKSLSNPYCTLPWGLFCEGLKYLCWILLSVLSTSCSSCLDVGPTIYAPIFHLCSTPNNSFAFLVLTSKYKLDR